MHAHPRHDTTRYYSLTPFVQCLPGVEHDTQVRHRQLVHLKGWLSVVVRQLLLLGHAAAMLSHSCSSVGGRVRALDGEVVLEAHCGIHLERERDVTSREKRRDVVIIMVSVKK